LGIRKRFIRDKKEGYWGQERRLLGIRKRFNGDKEGVTYQEERERKQT